MKGYANLDGPLAPILAIMIKADEYSNRLLDDSSAAEEDLNYIKSQLVEFMHTDAENLNEKYEEMFNEEPSPNIKSSLLMIGNPLKFMEKMYEFMEILIDGLEKKLEEAGVAQEVTESYYVTPTEFATIFHASNENLENEGNEVNEQ